MRPLLATFFLIQIALPAWQLFQPRVQRFGWHMYSGLPAPLDMTLTLDDGTVRSLSAGELLAERRSEMNEPERRIIARAACEANPDAVEVSMIVRKGSEPESISCR
ncbi:MAG TPA: hypothetical protein VKZ41_13450 [Gemmatimonadales bacterium]|nr:hypothetical protein [Gemmatimonadales bacterium]